MKMRDFLLLFCIYFCSFNSYAQKTYVPDNSFEDYLENNGMGDGIYSNDSVLTVNISSIQSLYVQNKNISDLTGIEDFSSLQYFNCNFNQIVDLDLSNNTYLISIKCKDNPQLITIDLRNGNNTAITIFVAYNCPNLTCILVDNLSYFQSTFTAYNYPFSTICGALPGCTDSTACNYNPLATWDDGSCLSGGGCTDPLANNYDINALCDNGSCTYDLTYVPDNSFEDYLENNGMGDGIYSNDSVLTVNISSKQSLDVQNKNISDLTGIEDFSSLQYFNCNFNQIVDLDLSNNTYLISIKCKDNPQLITIDLRNGNNTAITIFVAYNCPNLTCILVDNLSYFQSTFTAYNYPFSTICGALPGCTDSIACNYNPLATTDDGSCTLPGCTNTSAVNYDPSAGCDDGSCTYNNPQLYSISPNSGDQGESLSVTISGANINYGNQWSGTLSSFRFSQWSGSNMFYGNPTSTSGNNLYGSVIISSSQNTGWYDLEVYDQNTGNWVQKNSAFYVNYTAPVAQINSISPSNGDQGQTLSVSISGSNMNYGSQWSGTLSNFRFSQWSGSNMFYGNPTNTSGNYLYGDVSIPNGQNTGWYDLEVYNQNTNQWVQKNSAFYVIISTCCTINSISP